MFDIGFSEVLVIFVLALVVLGPEKLPRVASQVGRWLGRARAMARQFREQLEEEIHLEEARRTPIARTPDPIPEPVSPSAATGQSPATVPNPAAATIPAMTPSSPVAPSTQAEAAIVYPDTYSHAHPTDREGRPITAAEAAILYGAASPSADAGHATTTQSNASPTYQAHASPGSPAAETPSSDSAAARDEDSRQQDWVGGVSAAQKAPQGAADAAYAPANERGTRKTG